MAIKNKDGIKLTSPSEVCSRWKEYCSELYDDNQDDIEIEVTEREPPPTMSEVARPIRSLSKHKSPGLDGIPAEYFQYAGSTATEKLHEVCKEVWESGDWPQDWSSSIFIPLPKKGDLLQCCN